MKKAKIVCAVSALCLLLCMACGCNMYGLGYTDCTVNGCYLFGDHVIPSAGFSAEKDACLLAVKEHRDDLDAAAEELLRHGGEVSVFFNDGTAVVVCDDPELSAALSADGELMSCLDRLAREPRFTNLLPLRLSLNSPDSVYGICVSMNTDVPAYNFCANYVTDPETLVYYGENILGDWYFSAYMME